MNDEKARPTGNRKKATQRVKKVTAPRRSTVVNPAEKALAEVKQLIEQHGITDLDELNILLRQILKSGKPPESFLEPAISTPLDEAQDVMYKAFSATGRQREKLARRALEISPDCADAYVLLGDSSRTPEQAKAFYEQGVQAGERAIKATLGDDAFTRDAGSFWGILETRPYMRARASLAQALWEMDEREAAITHLRELLRLNPGDNQGLRYVLATYLVAFGLDDEAGKLLDAYKKDDSAHWLFTRALLLFRRRKTAAATKALKTAFAANAYVPKYLLGIEKPPRGQSKFIQRGGPSEAMDYILGNVDGWMTTPEALIWMAKAFLPGDLETAARVADTITAMWSERHDLQ